MSEHLITDRAGLHRIYPEPKGLAVGKQLSALDEHCRAFIARAPFLILGTEGDVSPKGDGPGFVRVMDEETLLIPDRWGNNRLDSLCNILVDPRVGLLFMIPGIGETLRVQGTARITTDPELLEPMALKGRVPASGIMVHVEEAFFHCAKSMRRSKLWNPEAQTRRSELTHPGRAMALQGGTGPDAGERSYDEGIEAAMVEEGRE